VSTTLDAIAFGVTGATEIGAIGMCGLGGVIGIPEGAGGIIGGCATGYVATDAVYTTVVSPITTTLGAVSTLATAIADIEAGETRIEGNQLIIGKNGINSLATTVLGGLARDVTAGTLIEAEQFFGNDLHATLPILGPVPTFPLGFPIQRDNITVPWPFH
jgi:hypothetical protein